MSLETELGFTKPIQLLAHEALMSTYHTAACLRKKASEFLAPFGVTDVQFNLMMLLRHQSGPEGGLKQSSISRMMLVNRANITSLIDRMEKADLVVRTNIADDRRCHLVQLTEHGLALMDRIEPLYAREVERIMAVVNQSTQRQLIDMLDKIRARARE
jgi:DNA-binding MarR family transcriptional regulator